MKKSVESALLHMTEKKMEAEQKLEEAMELIAQKDARIAELEALVRNLSGGTMGTMPSSVQHNLL